MRGNPIYVFILQLGTLNGYVQVSGYTNGIPPSPQLCARTNMEFPTLPHLVTCIARNNRKYGAKRMKFHLDGHFTKLCTEFPEIDRIFLEIKDKGIESIANLDGKLS